MMILRAVEGGAVLFLRVASAVIFAALVVFVTIQVFTRQILQSPAAWTEEAARYTFIVAVYLTAALVFFERGHIAVQMLLRRLKPRPQLVLATVLEVMVFAFCAYVFVYGGARIVANAWNQGLVAIPGTVGMVYLVMPIAGVLICLSSLVQVVRMWRGEIPALPATDEDIEV